MAAGSGVPRLAPLPPDARNRDGIKTGRARTGNGRMGNRSDLATGRGGQAQQMDNNPSVADHEAGWVSPFLLLMLQLGLYQSPITLWIVFHRYIEKASHRKTGFAE